MDNLYAYEKIVIILLSMVPLQNISNFVSYIGMN